MANDMLKPWTQGSCDACGCGFHLTRSEGRPRREQELCGECAAYAKAETEADARIEAIRAENADLRRERDRFEARWKREKKRGDELHNIVARIAHEGHVEMRRADKAEAEARLLRAQRDAMLAECEAAIRADRAAKDSGRRATLNASRAAERIRAAGQPKGGDDADEG